MTGLERITERILADAKEDARKILEQAQADCRAAADDYYDRAEALREELADRAMAEGEALIARARSTAAMTRRDILLSKREELIDEAFRMANKKLCATDYGKYRELLIALLAAALLDQHKNEQQSREYGDEVEPVEKFEVLLNARDRERFGMTVIEGARRVTERRIGADKTARITLAQDAADIDGGLVLRYGDIEINCSLSVIFARMRRDLEGKLSALLFGQ